MKKFIGLLWLILLGAGVAQGQQNDYTGLDVIPETSGALRLLDSPTADILKHGEIEVSCLLMESGSIIPMGSVGFFGRLQMGLSWGLLNLLGRGDVDSYEYTGIEIKLQLLQEDRTPGLAVGFNNQGHGKWDGALERYSRKSKGFYGVITRHWYGPWGSDFNTSHGVNYTLENNDESGVDLWSGFEMIFEQEFSLSAEYSLGLNDNRITDKAQGGHPEGHRYGDGRGWLDCGFHWTFEEALRFSFIFRDLLSNYRDPADGTRKSVDRQVMISYRGTF